MECKVKFFLSMVFSILAFGLLVGTFGGISDNIHFKDWFSVTMWAIFGPIGTSLFASSARFLLASWFIGPPEFYGMKPATKYSAVWNIIGWASVMWLFLVTVSLITGTVGGIHDNVQFKDWFSVSMWAVFGTLGFICSAIGMFSLIGKMVKTDTFLTPKY
jgi:hypothetical protein